MNLFIGMGNLTRDPELKYTVSGTEVCNFSIAINEKYKADNNEYKTRVTFIPVVAWGKTAENCNKYLVKGSAVFIEGRIEIKDYDKQDGSKGKSISLVVKNIKFLSKSDSGEGRNSNTSETPGEQPAAMEDYGEPF